MKKLFAVLASAGGALYGQLTAEQRVIDFDAMTALYAKRYAPASWKAQLFGVNLFDVAAWRERVRAARDDLEFFEICAEYVARLQDTHASYAPPFAGSAWLGFSVDLYDGKVLIEQINRTLLPVARFPFVVGDELVSVDGRGVEQWITHFQRFRGAGNPRYGRRIAADAITLRTPSRDPRSLELGEAAQVVVRRDGGEVETYTIPWLKTGANLKKVGPVPTPSSLANPIVETMDDALKLAGMGLVKVDVADILGPEPLPEEPRRALLGYGGLSPVWQVPAGFNPRLGRLPTDEFTSGTYTSDGLRIGYLRIPSFSPGLFARALAQLEAEVAFMNANTDGLVVDVMRNPGGAVCAAIEYARLLTPSRFTTTGFAWRPVLAQVLNLESAYNQLVAQRAERWIIDNIKFQWDAVKLAYEQGRGMTGPLPLCYLDPDVDPPTDRQGEIIAYRKPLIVLVDEFSTSGGDMFPSMLQDSKRGPLVGMRTNGAGGSVTNHAAGYYSEAFTRNTDSIMVRKAPVKTPEFPEVPFVENVGVRPDIEMDYMTRDNLTQSGRPFVAAFTRVMVEHIRANTPR